MISLGEWEPPTALLFSREESFPFPTPGAKLLLSQHVVVDYNSCSINDYFVSVTFLNCDTIWKEITLCLW